MCPFSAEELRSRQFWTAVLAELLGTLVLVSAVLGASVPGPGEAPVGPLYPAVAVGVVIISLAHCFGEISGAQVNTVQRHLENRFLFFSTKQPKGCWINVMKLSIKLKVGKNRRFYVK